MSSFPRSTLAGLLTTVFLLVPGLTPQIWTSAAGPVSGRENAIIGISQEPDTLNPLFAEMSASVAIMAAIFTVDVQRNQRGVAFPQGVTSLPNLRDGSWKLRGDAMTLVWVVRARNWHDGKPVTCADYVFSHNVARNEQVPVVVRDLTNRISNVVCSKGAAGTHVTVNWKERYPYANLAITEYGAIPSHVLGPFYRQSASRLNAAPYGNDPKVTIGDGAYRVVEWRHGTSITVEVLAGHPIFGTPQINRLTWRIIPDTNALVANMLSGTIDAIGTIGISFDQAVQLDRQAGGRFKVLFEPGMIWEHIDFNLDNLLLQDVRVRRALVHGINREQLVRELFDGKQPVAHSYLPPKHPGYTEAVQKYPYDPAQARALLQAAGFTLGSDGTMRDGQDRRLSLELNTTAGNRIREQVAQIIQQSLREIGVEIRIRTYPARAYFGEITNQRKFPALAMYAWVLSPTGDCDQLYTSDGIPSQGNGWAGQNYPGYKSGDMDRVCKAVSREVDEIKRKALLNESVAIFARDLPAIPLYDRVQVAVAKAGLLGFGALQLGSTYETWNAHRWSWQ